MAKQQAQTQTFFSWKPEEEFTMLGVELEFYLGMLNKKLSTEAAQEVISAYEFKKLLDKKVEEGLKNGKIKEKGPE